MWLNVTRQYGQIAQASEGCPEEEQRAGTSLAYPQSGAALAKLVKATRGHFDFSLRMVRFRFILH